MVQLSSPHLQQELTRCVQARTGRQIRELAVELGPECVTLRGFTSTFYFKQLAQHGIRDVLPHVGLENAIVVDG